MLDSEYELFVDEIKLLAERLPKSLSARLIEAYFDTLKKYDLSTVRFVMRNWPKRSGNRKFPNESELRDAVKGNSTREYAKTQDEDLNKQRQLEELEKEFTLICKQICANGVNTKDLIKYPAMKRLMQLNGKTAQELNRDYNAYKTDLTTDQLYDKQNELRRKMSDLLRG